MGPLPQHGVAGLLAGGHHHELGLVQVPGHALPGAAPALEPGQEKEESVLFHYFNVLKLVRSRLENLSEFLLNL